MQEMDKKNTSIDSYLRFLKLYRESQDLKLNAHNNNKVKEYILNRICEISKKEEEEITYQESTLAQFEQKIKNVIKQGAPWSQIDKLYSKYYQRKPTALVAAQFLEIVINLEIALKSISQCRK